MKKIVIIMMILAVLILFTGCLPGDVDFEKEPAGFLWGILHGWLAPLSLVLSFLNDSTHMFELNNTGFWYEFGFYIAIIGGFGGLSLTRNNKRKNK